jgi:hypothetical protein
VVYLPHGRLADVPAQLHIVVFDQIGMPESSLLSS